MRTIRKKIIKLFSFILIPSFGFNFGYGTQKFDMQTSAAMIKNNLRQENNNNDPISFFEFCFDGVQTKHNILSIRQDVTYEINNTNVANSIQVLHDLKCCLPGMKTYNHENGLADASCSDLNKVLCATIKEITDLNEEISRTKYRQYGLIPTQLKNLQTILKSIKEEQKEEKYKTVQYILNNIDIEIYKKTDDCHIIYLILKLNEFINSNIAYTATGTLKKIKDEANKNTTLLQNAFNYMNEWNRNTEEKQRTYKTINERNENILKKLNLYRNQQSHDKHLQKQKDINKKRDNMQTQTKDNNSIKIYHTEDLKDMLHSQQHLQLEQYILLFNNIHSLIDTRLKHNKSSSNISHIGSIINTNVESEKRNNTKYNTKYNLINNEIYNTVDAINKNIPKEDNKIKGTTKYVFKKVNELILEGTKGNKTLEKIYETAKYNSQKLKNADEWTYKTCAEAFGYTFVEKENTNNNNKEDDIDNKTGIDQNMLDINEIQTNRNGSNIHNTHKTEEDNDIKINNNTIEKVECLQVNDQLYVPYHCDHDTKNSFDHEIDKINQSDNEQLPPLETVERSLSKSGDNSPIATPYIQYSVEPQDNYQRVYQNTQTYLDMYPRADEKNTNLYSTWSNN
jgi:hypothetical protein